MLKFMKWFAGAAAIAVMGALATVYIPGIAARMGGQDFTVSALAFPSQDHPPLPDEFPVAIALAKQGQPPPSPADRDRYDSGGDDLNAVRFAFKNTTGHTVTNVRLHMEGEVYNPVVAYAPQDGNSKARDTPVPYSHSILLPDVLPGETRYAFLWCVYALDSIMQSNDIYVTSSEGKTGIHASDQRLKWVGLEPWTSEFAPMFFLFALLILALIGVSMIFHATSSSPKPKSVDLKATRDGEPTTVGEAAELSARAKAASEEAFRFVRDQPPK